LPGETQANVRTPLLTTRNLAHLLPCTQTWEGPSWDAHLHGPPLFLATTRGQTPLRVSLHDADVGHVGLIGRTGNGKSTLLNFLCLQWQRYPHAETVIFDKAGAARHLTAAVGGAWHDIGLTPLQPLARIDQPYEIPWALEWCEGVLAAEQTRLTPAFKEELAAALTTLATYDVIKRTMTTLVELLDHPRLRQALRAYTHQGPYGMLVDGCDDALADNRWLCFELERVLDTPRILNAVIPALFHRLEQRLTGVPVRYVFHEGWIAFETPYWAQRLRAHLKGLRTKNASVILATQSLGDAVDSSIMSALLDNVPTWIYTANSRAMEDKIGSYYTALGLNERQRQIIAHAVPKKDYYLVTTAGQALFQLELGPSALALCKTPNPKELRTIEAMITQDAHGFLANYLRMQGVELACSL
jgi:type IV secretory pathway VirB4 component